MKRLARGLLSPWLALLALGFANGAAATIITYEATDLPDGVGPGDRWQYSYKVSGFVGPGGFNVLFSPALYGNLGDPPPAVNSDWGLLVVQPDAALPADGFYGATTFVATPSLVDAFTVTFDWLGNGSPGSQPFEVFDESFALVSPFGAQTQAAAVGQVPIPGTLALLGFGLLALGARRAANRTR